MELDHSTIEPMDTEAQGGEQAEVVASPEAAQAGEDREEAVDLQNDDFRMVEADSGKADGDDEADGAENAPAPGDADRGREQQAKTRQTREENAAYRAMRLRSQREAATETQREQQRQAWFRQDLADFMDTHPEVDVTALDNNRHFRLFVGSRYGSEPLSQLYDDYMAIVGDAGAAAVKRAEERASRSTGSGSAGSAVLSPRQKTALKEWNEEHPEMAMTAKEYLQR